MLLAHGAASWFGTLPGWLTLATLLGAAYAFRRGGGGTAIELLETANRVLERRVHDLERDGATKDRQISELQGRTDVALAIVPVVEWTRIHEDRAQSRHEATLGVLELIAHRLGPEPNGEHEAAA